jgi:hypothetical protein
MNPEATMRTYGKTTWFFFFTLVGLFALVFIVSAWDHPASAGGAEASTAPPLRGMQVDTCDAVCDGLGCTTAQHRWDWFGVGSEGWKSFGDPDSHGCRTGSCEGHQHYPCSGPDEEQELEHLLKALENLDRSEIQAMIEQNPGRMLWNSNR